MEINNVNCNIFIGKGAGQELLKDIENAKKSVKIVSPYLSSSLVGKLIKLCDRNLEVKLITVDNIDNTEISLGSVPELIIQNKEIDNLAFETREHWIDISKILAYVIVGLLLTWIGLIFFLQDLKVLFGIIPISVLYLIYRLYRKKIREKKIYRYSYSQRFPFKVYRSPNMDPSSDTFIHSKIYLIDDSLAYLGSLNFTSSGTKDNYEAQIRTKDPLAVNKIKEEFDQLFNHSHLPEVDMKNWGKGLYKEPLN